MNYVILKYNVNIALVSVKIKETYNFGVHILLNDLFLVYAPRIEYTISDFLTLRNICIIQIIIIKAYAYLYWNVMYVIVSQYALDHLEF
jgi:hypothetical protein